MLRFVVGMRARWVKLGRVPGRGRRRGARRSTDQDGRLLVGRARHSYYEVVLPALGGVGASWAGLVLSGRRRTGWGEPLRSSAGGATVRSVA